MRQKNRSFTVITLYWTKAYSADALADLYLHCCYYVVRLHLQIRHKLLLFLNENINYGYLIEVLLMSNHIIYIHGEMIPYPEL